MRGILLAIILLGFAGCSPNNVDVDETLAPYFTETHTEGCFGIFDNRSGKFTIYNLPRYRDSSFLPASTFKIVNSLIGLQTGVISNDSMVIKWDGVERSIPEWNQDLSMYQAFRLSAVPYYQEVARRIGADRIKLWVDSLHYGNANVSGPIDSFWLNNRLKITPDEQLGLVKRLYFDQLPFFKSYQHTVKKAMLMEDKPAYKLYYKTGLGEKENGHPLAWVLGWVEENGHPYPFVLNLESADTTADLIVIRQKILKEVLTHLGFLQGNK